MAQEALRKTWMNMKQTVPMIVTVVFLIAWIVTVVPHAWYGAVFTGHSFLDAFIGSFLGSVSTGNPVTSYIIGGELETYGVSTIAIAAFVLAWVTVGIFQYPAERALLGKKFAFWRNVTAFILAIAGGVLTALSLSFFA